MPSTSEILNMYSDRRDVVQQRVGERRGLERRLADLEGEVADLKLDAATTEKAVWLLQQYAETQQREVIDKIEHVVTSGLQSVFQNTSLEFKLYYSQTKGGTQKKAPEITMAVFYDYGGEMVKGDIKNSFGGGLSVVVATLLRVAIVRILGSRRVRPILFLDENLKDLSPDYDGAAHGYRHRMAQFLKILTRDMDIQVIMVTHEPNYAEVSDVDYRFSGSIGKSPKVVKHEDKDTLEGGM